ncbi:MAG TPA: hypothetical protein VKA79_16285, partial [Aestuariivirgaceae bacterium]|nr:hypothetical protein [Aestuariivirgaceae bacterium]
MGSRELVPGSKARGSAARPGFAMGPAATIAVVALFAPAAVASGQALRRGDVEQGYASDRGYC